MAWLEDKETRRSPSKRRLGAQGPTSRSLHPGELLQRALRWRRVVFYALLLMGALFAAWHALFPNPTRYILVMDAGSSGTRLFAYTWRPGAAPGDPPLVAAIPPGAAAAYVPRRAMPAKRAYQRVETEPGLDHFVGDSRGLERRSLGPLLHWAQAAVPRHHWHRTPVFLCATAGLRKLPEEEQEALMGGVRSALKGSPFRFEDPWARIISGEDEGVYGWIALNYLSGAFHGALSGAPGPDSPNPGDAAAGAAGGAAAARRPTVGVLDLGGSSLEVAFELDPESVEGEELQALSRDTVNVTVLGRSYSLYVHVHHHYGLNDAFDRSISLLLAPPQPPAIAGSPSPSADAADSGTGAQASTRPAAGEQSMGGEEGTATKAEAKLSGSSAEGSSGGSEAGSLGQAGSGAAGAAAGAGASARKSKEGAAIEGSGELVHPTEPSPDKARPTATSDSSSGTSGSSGGGAIGEGVRAERRAAEAAGEQAAANGGMAGQQKGVDPGSIPLPRGKAAAADLAAQDPQMAADLARHGARHGERAQQAVQATFQEGAAAASSTGGSGSHSSSEGAGEQQRQRSRRSLLALLQGTQERLLSAAGLTLGRPGGPSNSASGQSTAAAAAAYEALAARLQAEELASQPQALSSVGSVPEQPLQRRRRLLGRPIADETQGSASGGGGKDAAAAEASTTEDVLADASELNPNGTAAGKEGTGAAAGPQLPEVPHPCLHEGYAKPYTRLRTQGSDPDPPEVLLVGSSDHAACAELAARVVNASAPCGAATCMLGTPRPPSSGPFQALTGFYVVYHFFGLHSRQEMRQLQQVGREFCGKPWAQVERERANEIHVDRYCFRAPFVEALLGEGLGVEERHLQLGTPDVGWTLGAALAEGSRLGIGGEAAAMPLSLSRQGLLHLPRLGGLTKRQRLAAAGVGAALLLLGAALARRRGRGGEGGGAAAYPKGLPLGVLVQIKESPEEEEEHLAGASLPPVGAGDPSAALSGGLGGMLAVPASHHHHQPPPLGGLGGLGLGGEASGAGMGSPGSSPIYQRLFGTPPKKRLDPPARDLPAWGSTAWGGGQGEQGLLRRDVSATSLARMSRSQAVSRRGISVEEIAI